MDMELQKSMLISASGMKAQMTRMRVVAENIANSGSEASEPGEAPYRRKLVTFEAALDNAVGAETVTVGKIDFDQSEFGQRFDPGHPGANAEGYVLTTNVNPLIESMDMSQAQRSYQANMNAIEAVKTIGARTLELLR